MRIGLPWVLGVWLFGAGHLLGQFISGLATRNQRKLLSAVDFTRMKDGARFQQQINSFLAQAGTIRIHYSRLRTSDDFREGVEIRRQAPAEFSRKMMRGSRPLPSVQPAARRLNTDSPRRTSIA